MSELPTTFRVKSFGCQMNVYDGERMGELLTAEGMIAAPDGADADLVVLNTCHIREKAADKAYSDVGRLTREDGSRPMIAGQAAREDGSRPMIALAGCVAQAEGPEAKRRSKMIDLWSAHTPITAYPRWSQRWRVASARSIPTCLPSPSSTRSPRAAGPGRAPS